MPKVRLFIKFVVSDEPAVQCFVQAEDANAAVRAQQY